MAYRARWGDSQSEHFGENSPGKLIIAAALVAGDFPEHTDGCPTEPVSRHNNGCDAVAPIAVFELELDPGRRTEFFRCPFHYITPDIWEFMRYFVLYRRGFLPNGPALCDNSGVFLEALQVFEAELSARKPDGTG